jgi:hypothetical protein
MIKILKVFRFHFRIVIGVIGFLILLSMIIYNFFDISKSLARGIALYAFGGSIFAFLMWQFGFIDWVKGFIKGMRSK